MNEWRTIKDAPRDGTSIDVWLTSILEPKIGFRKPDVWWGSYCQDFEGWISKTYDGCNVYIEWAQDGYKATHWMPQPEPPEGCHILKIEVK